MGFSAHGLMSQAMTLGRSCSAMNSCQPVPRQRCCSVAVKWVLSGCHAWERQRRWAEWLKMQALCFARSLCAWLSKVIVHLVGECFNGFGQVVFVLRGGEGGEANAFIVGNLFDDAWHAFFGSGEIDKADAHAEAHDVGFAHAGVALHFIDLIE